MFVSLLALRLPEECERKHLPSHQLDLDLDAMAILQVRIYVRLYISKYQILRYVDICVYTHTHRPSFKMHPLCTSQNFTG